MILLKREYLEQLTLISLNVHKPKQSHVRHNSSSTPRRVARASTGANAAAVALVSDAEEHGLGDWALEDSMRRVVNILMGLLAERVVDGQRLIATNDRDLQVAGGA